MDLRFMLEYYGQNKGMQMATKLFLLVAKQVYLYWLRLLTCPSNLSALRKQPSRTFEQWQKLSYQTKPPGLVIF